MLHLIQKIIINGYEFSNTSKGGNMPLVFNVEITSDRKSFISTATIEIANRIVGDPLNNATKVFKIGSPVEIWLGYEEYGLIKEFEGYVSTIIVDFNATINCEDEGYVYKRSMVNSAYFTLDEGIKLKTLMDKVYPKKNSLTGKPSKFIIPKSNPNIGVWSVAFGSMIFDVLETLRNTFSLFSYYRGDTLIVGGGVTDEDRDKEKTIVVDFQGNVPHGTNGLNSVLAMNNNAIVKGKVQYRNSKGEVLYAMYGVGNKIDFKESVDAGQFNCIVAEINLGLQDKDAMHQNNMISLKSMLERRLKAISYDGLYGNVEIFGYPSAKHGDIANVKDKYRPEIQGNYKISSVVKSFSTSGGYRQKLFLAQKLF